MRTRRCCIRTTWRGSAQAVTDCKRRWRHVLQTIRYHDMNRAVHHMMKSKRFLNLYNEWMKEVMCSMKGNGLWNENQERKMSFVGYIQKFSYKTPATLKALHRFYTRCLLCIYPFRIGQTMAYSEFWRLLVYDLSSAVAVEREKNVKRMIGMSCLWWGISLPWSCLFQIRFVWSLRVRRVIKEWLWCMRQCVDC